MSTCSLTRPQGLAATLLLLAVVFGVPATARAQDGYVTIRNERQLLTLDPTDPTDVSRRIDFVGSTAGVAVSPDGSTVYVIENATVRVISGGVLDPTPIALNGLLEQLVVTPDGDKLYITDVLGSRLRVVDLAAGNAVSNIDFNPNDGPWDVDVATTAAGVYAYVSLAGTAATADVVQVIDVATDSVATTIPVGADPQGVASSPLGDLVYVANAGSNSVSVIDTASNAVLTTVDVGASPQELTVSDDGGLVYVTLRTAGSVAVIDTTTFVLADTIPVGGDGEGLHGISFSADGSRVVVAHFTTDRISVIDPSDGNSFVTVGPPAVTDLDGPRYVAFTPLAPVFPDLPPVFDLPLCDSQVTAAVDELLELPLSVSDDDGVVVSLQETPATGGDMQPALPLAPATLVQSEFVWTPGDDDAGDYALEYRADDGFNPPVTCAVRINVPEPPDPPEPPTPDVTPFQHFGLWLAKLKYTRFGTAFWFSGGFKLDTEAGDGIDPANEAVTLAVEGVEWIIPAGALKRFGFGRHYLFRSTIDGTPLFVHLVRIGRPGSGRFHVVVHGRRATIEAAENPLELCLTIGNDAGCARRRGWIR